MYFVDEIRSQRGPVRSLLGPVRSRDFLGPRHHYTKPFAAISRSDISSPKIDLGQMEVFPHKNNVVVDGGPATLLYPDGPIA